MKFTGFVQADFDLFKVSGLEERMSILKSQLRPKFEALGEDLKGDLGLITAGEAFVHVAKHARRKTNPPNDSWVALAIDSPRGYKMHPHFQICVWHTHVLVQWGIIYEAKNKAVFADNLAKNVAEIKKRIPAHYQWYKDHMKPNGTVQSDMSDQDFLDFAHRLKHNKNGEVMVGLSIPSEEAIAMSPEAFHDLVVDTWKKLHYLHKLAH